MTDETCAVLNGRRPRLAAMTDDELTTAAAKVETHAGEVGQAERHLVDEEREYRIAIDHQAEVADIMLAAAMAPPVRYAHDGEHLVVTR